MSMKEKTIEEISHLDGLHVLMALETKSIKVNDIDKAVLVLDKIQTLGVTKPGIQSRCKHLENYIKTYKS